MIIFHILEGNITATLACLLMFVRRVCDRSTGRTSSVTFETAIFHKYNEGLPCTKL